MKINPLTVSQIYSSNTLSAGSAAQKPSSEEKGQAAKVDTISISAEGIRKNDTSKLAKQIAAELNQDTSSERIELLRKRIANNTYNVAAEKIADSILDRFKA